MNTATPGDQTRQPFKFKRLSIQQRLPLFICILLLVVIFTFSWVSYLGVKNASVSIGAERLTTLSDKLASIFKQSTALYASASAKIASDKNVKQYLTSGARQGRAEAVKVLQELEKKDTLCKLAQLLGPQFQPLLSAGDEAIARGANVDSLTRAAPGKKAHVTAGRFILVKGAMYFPVLAEVKDGNRLAGYTVNWQLIHATQESIDQLAQLLGANSKLYFGNDDGKFWTDLVRPVAKPPVELAELRRVAQYSRKDGQPLIASMRKIPDSKWLMVVELSSASFLKTANIYLRWVFILGGFLVIAGSLGGWVMSRNITTPIKKLSEAASSIAAGDYSSFVEVEREDELGRLAGRSISWQKGYEGPSRNWSSRCRTAPGNSRRP